jgi:hypothetical protein
MSIKRTDESLNNAVHLLKRRSSRAGLSGTEKGVPSAVGGAVSDLERWAGMSVRLPWFEKAEYRFRFGSHRLILGNQDLSARREAAVRTAEAEFALVVEGPLIVLGSRFGSFPWVWASPYNWHFALPAERTVPPRVPLTRASFARLWASLRIMSADSSDGKLRLLRAAALHPRFTHALHVELHEQAVRPFPVKAAGRALDNLTHAAESLESRIRVRSRSAAVTDRGGGRSMARTTQPALARGLSLGTERWLTT